MAIIDILDMSLPFSIKLAFLIFRKSLTDKSVKVTSTILIILPKKCVLSMMIILFIFQ
jgi:hypothetical protein